MKRASLVVSICAWLANFAFTQTRISPAASPQADAVSPSASIRTAEDENPAVVVGTSAAPAGSDVHDLVIGNGDLLEVSVYGAAEFDKLQMRVSGGGNVVLPFIGRQRVAGLTAAQAESVISKQLADGGYFHNPQVSVFVRDYSSQGVSVLGEVQKPGVYPLFGTRHLFDAISMAGGLTPKAGKLVTIAHRNQTDRPLSVNLGSDVKGSVEGNTLLSPGDTVVVSKAGIVYVVGDVHLPGGFVMENGHMTVLQALALAQGANPTASLNSAKVIRTIDGKHSQTPVELKLILSAKAVDVTLAAGDILFVPASIGKSAARRSLDAIVQVATGVAIYGRY
jgi:polysaccharide export outer membrane protein